MTVLAAAALAAGCAGVPDKLRHAVPSLPGLGPSKANHPKVDPQLPAPAARRGGYYKDDGPADNPPAGLDQVPDAQVKAEPYSRYANRPYTVFGKTYIPLVDDRAFEQRGVASWYGKKFHGQRTSSGELYDMYKMTAAHPTLPIPSYARITSVGNGKQVVVRINDRGPFHASRVVDVSYTAALKLGLLGKGSHEVMLERLLPGAAANRASTRRNAFAAPETALPAAVPAYSPQADAAEIAALVLEGRAEARAAAAPIAAAPAVSTAGFWVQLGAFSQAAAAQQVGAQVRTQMSTQAAGEGGPFEVQVEQAGAVYRLLGGPFATRALAAAAAAGLPAALRLKPIVIKR